MNSLLHTCFTYVHTYAQEPLTAIAVHYVHSHTSTLCTQPHLYMCSWEHVHSIHTHTRTVNRTLCIRVGIHTYMHTHMNSHTHSHSQANQALCYVKIIERIHTYTHTYMHAYIYAHTWIHTGQPSLLWGRNYGDYFERHELSQTKQAVVPHDGHGKHVFWPVQCKSHMWWIVCCSYCQLHDKGVMVTFHAFQWFSGGKLVLKNVESRFATIKYVLQCCL
jgi:hypothetical protein